MSGKTITLQTKDISTVESIKFQIQDKEGIPPEEQLFLFKGKQLSDYEILRELHITNESILRLVLRLREGNCFTVKIFVNGNKRRASIIFDSFRLNHYPNFHNLVDKACKILQIKKEEYDFVYKRAIFHWGESYEKYYVQGTLRVYSKNLFIRNILDVVKCQKVDGI